MQESKVVMESPKKDKAEILVGVKPEEGSTVKIRNEQEVKGGTTIGPMMSAKNLLILECILAISTFVFPIIALCNHFLNLDPTLRLLVYLACSAGMGCTVYSNLVMVQHVSHKEQEASYFIWYVFRPLIAIPLGIFVYFMVAGGLLVLGNASIPENDTQRMMFLYSIAFLAGFSIDSMIKKMYEIVNVIFSSQGKNPGTEDNNIQSISLNGTKDKPKDPKT